MYGQGRAGVIGANLVIPSRRSRRDTHAEGSKARSNVAVSNLRSSSRARRQESFKLRLRPIILHPQRTTCSRWERAPSAPGHSDQIKTGLPEVPSNSSMGPTRPLALISGYIFGQH